MAEPIIGSWAPRLFAAPSESLAAIVRSCAKDLFKRAADLLPPQASTGPARPALGELLTDGFDAEQVWTQANAPAAENDEDEDGNHGDGEEEEDAVEKEEEGLTLKQPGPLDDRFLKMDDLEKFLVEAEAQDEKSRSEKPQGDDQDDDDDEEDDGDLLNTEVNDDDGEIMYEDFFGAKPTPATRTSKKLQPAVEKDDDEILQEDENGEDRTEEQEEGDEDVLEEGSKSKHERRALKIARQVTELEEANINEKQWTMRGEISANARPKNSVLAAELDFQHTARAPPVVTAEAAASMEDLIKARIIEGRFDDPIRKEAQSGGKKRPAVELDDVKSKKGLGEIYEEEYVKTQTPITPAAIAANDKLHAEAKALFKDLCGQLDALSHFHFTPRPAVEEMEIRLDVPSLAMEEVMPITMGSGELQAAPHEIYSSEAAKGGKRTASGGLQGDGEAARGPKRRKIKKLQREKQRKPGQQEKSASERSLQKAAPVSTASVFSLLENEKLHGVKGRDVGPKSSGKALKL